ncbi:hypothetical protein M5K25_006839 [Dendrobium thyrsiflorum]|uniref:FAR1 domain-containing protein n=1 Tax=Dendrobium thyrsiflorum TaxID=117978 RepID=A0ABD0VDR5_DENTH
MAEEKVSTSTPLSQVEDCEDPAKSPPNSPNSSTRKVVYKCEKEAYDAYCRYAHNTGFSMHKDHHSYWPNSRNIKSKVDFKKRFDLNSQTKYQKLETRTGCPSFVRFVVDEAGNWNVKKFIESHNHELARLEGRHLLRLCRNINDEKVSVLNSMIEAEIRIVDVFSYLAEEVGGVLCFDTKLGLEKVYDWLCGFIPSCCNILYNMVVYPVC